MRPRHPPPRERAVSSQPTNTLTGAPAVPQTARRAVTVLARRPAPFLLGSQPRAGALQPGSCTTAESRGAYAAIEYSHAPGAAGPPAHVHAEHEEAFLGTTGFHKTSSHSERNGPAPSKTSIPLTQSQCTTNTRRSARRHLCRHIRPWASRTRSSWSSLIRSPGVGLLADGAALGQFPIVLGGVLVAGLRVPGW